MSAPAGTLTRVRRAARSRLQDLPDLASVPFSGVFSDHMLVAEYAGGAWRNVDIVPYGPLSIAPSISALHYGVSAFEGLKAHRTQDDRVAIFRPRENARRLSRSAARLSMPSVPEEMFLEGLRELVRLDRDWTPALDRGALYIRPLLFSTDESIRVKPAERFTFLIFTFPFGSYYAEPLDVLVTERFVRAFPGGVGDIKPAGNYAPAMLADRLAKEAGFHTVMWLDAKERAYVEECGVMNMFFVIGDDIVTPSLDGTIMPGITRDSIISLLRDMGRTVRERRVSIAEILAAHERGELRECFGTGTAAIVSHVRRIRYRDRDIELPPVGEAGVGKSARDGLMRIATGRVADAHHWLDLV
jgi:branched-chain amino acid aminotransferase